MSTLGSLVVSLEANIAKFQSDMGKAVEVAHHSMDKINEYVEGAKKLMEVAFVGVSVEKVVEMGLQAVETGDQIYKAAQKAGVGSQTMAELAYAAKQADIDLATLSTGLKKMQVALAEAKTGGEKQNQALAALGLTYKELAGLSPDKQFELLGDRLSKMKDPTDRALAASVLFGKAWDTLIPLFEEGAHGIQELREEALRLGVAFSDDQYKKFADADDAIKKLSATWHAFAADLTSKVIPAVTQILNLMTGTTEKAALEEQEKMLEDMKKRLSERNKIVKFFFKPEFDVDAALADVRKQLERFKEAHHEEGGDAPGYKESDQDKARREAQAKADIAYSKALLALKELNLRQFLSKSIADWDEYYKHQNMMDALDVTLSRADLANREQQLHESIRVMAQDWDDYYQQQKKMHEQMTVFAEQAARNIQTSLANFLFDPFKGGLKGMLSGFVDTIRKMVAEAAAANILEAMFGKGKDGKGSGLGDALGGIFKSIFGGFFAAGGDPPVGKASIVGENGPELFIPRSAGTIIPNGAMAGAGGGNVTVNINAPNSTRESVNDLRAMVPAIVQAAVQQSRAQIRDDISRGEFRR